MESSLRVIRVSSQAMTSARLRQSKARNVMSAAFPIGVAMMQSP